MTTRKTLVVAGHGMVGHRFVQAAIERGLTERYDVVVVGEEPRAAYDRVALTSLLRGRERRRAVAAPRGRVRRPARAAGPRHPGRRRSTARRRRSSSATARSRATTCWCSPPAPARSCRRSRARTSTAASSTAPSRTSRRSARPSKTATVGAVIGGGLLGLEAANALVQLGLETHVVEMAPRLMPVQLDQAAGCHAGPPHREARRHRAHRRGDRGGARRRGRQGHRPGAQGRRRPSRPRSWCSPPASAPATCWPATPASTVAERGGILVDEQCRTNDPAIYAIGECAAPGGRMYGLVAPGYQMAEVVVDALLDGPGAFTGADMSTKLKLLGVDVASFGDAFATTEGALELVFADAVAGIYKKLVVATDEDGEATHLLGGILVGDASAYGILRPMVSSGMALPANPEELILPASRGAAADRHARRGGRLLVQQRHQGRDPRPCRRRRRRPAATSARPSPASRPAPRPARTCGSCVPVVKNLIERATRRGRQGGQQGHLRALRRSPARSSSTWSRCTATDASTTSSRRTAAAAAATSASRRSPRSWPASSTTTCSTSDTAPLQDTNDAYLANLQRNGTYSVVPADPRRRDHAREADRDRRGGPRLQPLHQDHRRPADRPVRRPHGAAARRSGSASSTPASSPATPTASRCAP